MKLFSHPRSCNVSLRALRHLENCVGVLLDARSHMVEQSTHLLVLQEVAALAVLVENSLTFIIAELASNPI